MNMYYPEVKKTLFIILILNLIVAIIKISYGLYSNILSISVDGYHSLFDGLSNIVGIIGITLASKPSNKQHPYGFAKIETLCSIIIGIFLFSIGFEVITEVIERINTPFIGIISIESFIVMFITMLINIGVSRYEKNKGEQLKSDFLISDSKHTKSDIYATLSIIIGLILMTMGFTIIDSILSIIIALIIFKIGYSIIHKNLKILLDLNIIPPDDIKRNLMKINGVNHVHNIRTRGTEANIAVDMHICVDSNISVEESSYIYKQCERVIYDKYSEVKDIIIKIEPEDGIKDEKILT